MLPYHPLSSAAMEFIKHSQASIAQALSKHMQGQTSTCFCTALDHHTRSPSSRSSVTRAARSTEETEVICVKKSHHSQADHVSLQVTVFTAVLVKDGDCTWELAPSFGFTPSQNNELIANLTEILSEWLKQGSAKVNPVPGRLVSVTHNLTQPRLASG